MRAAKNAGEACARGDVDDGPGTLAEKVAAGLAGTEVCALDIQIERSVPGLRGHLAEGHETVAASTVDQNVDPAELLDRAAEEVGDLFFAFDIGGDRQTSATGRLLNAVGRCLQVCFGSRTDHNICTMSRQ